MGGDGSRREERSSGGGGRKERPPSRPTKRDTSSSTHKTPRQVKKEGVQPPQDRSTPRQPKKDPARTSGTPRQQTDRNYTVKTPSSRSGDDGDHRSKGSARIPSNRSMDKDGGDDPSRRRNSSKQNEGSDETRQSSSEYREKGNKAFQEKNWSDAIRFYTKALRLDNRSFTCYSNRSAAYLKKGKLNEALQDANACVRLKPDYHKGHLRRGAALYEMKRYPDAILAYEKGLEYCPDDKTLLESIKTARQAKMSSSKASAAAAKSTAAKEASNSRKNKTKNAKSVSAFVKETKADLELQMAKINSQLDLLKELETMTEEEKLDLLYTLLDKDGDGHLDANELAVGMRKRNVDMTFSESIQKAIDLVAMFDDDGDARLDRDEFENFVEKMLEELQTSFDEFSEFLVFQILFTEDEEEGETMAKEDLDEEVKQRGTMLEMLSDPRMMSIFMLFDKDGDCAVGFKEVAMGLYQLTNSMEESAKATMQLLLMMDEKEDRVIGYEQFAKLIMAIVAAADSTFDEVADDLTHALTSNKKISDEAMEELFVADKIYKDRRKKEREEKLQAKVMDALSYGRTQRLFDLWDENSDGTIDINELMTGLSRYQNAVGKSEDDVQEVAEKLVDMIGNEEFDREDFALSMVNYADIISADIHELIDFMCVVTALGDGANASNYENAYKQAAKHGAIKKPKTLKDVPKLKELDVD